MTENEIDHCITTGGDGAPVGGWASSRGSSSSTAFPETWRVSGTRVEADSVWNLARSINRERGEQPKR